MEKATTVPKLNAQILEEAASWFVDFSEGDVDAAGRAAFNRWLRTSPEHVRAYLQISAFWEDADAMSRDRDLDMDALVERALAQSNVVALERADELRTALSAAGDDSSRASHDASANLRSHGQRRRPLAVAAAIAILATGAGITAWFQGYLAPTYSTAIGEQRSFTLEDGSTVELNSRSRLRVRFTEQERTVELLEGQALFKVAKNAARPFVVRSYGTRARAVGTQFDVYRKSDRTVVTVVEGRVAVSNALGGARPATSERPSAESTEAKPRARSPASTEPVLLSAGEQVTVSRRALTLPQSVNLVVATAWTQQKLIFDSAPLDEVVAEFNRYNRRQLVLDDAQLEDFHVSGVFASTDSQRMVEFLRQRFGVTVTESGDEIRIARP